MSERVAGIPLSSFQEPIRHTLDRYTTRTFDTLDFDLNAACQLELTPEKPNSARSVTRFRHIDRSGTLYVIAFAPGDGTGDEKTHRLFDVSSGEYPYSPKVVPRSKAGITTELHLSLASFHAEQPQADPVLYANNLELLGLREESPLALPVISRIGTLGLTRATFQRNMAGYGNAAPAVTYTVGYGESDADGTRAGDPHAVYNPHAEYVQVCGFIALSPTGPEDTLAELPHYLYAQRPTL